MINLELTEEEAFNLRTYLGVHHVKSAYDTYPVYEKLAEAMDSDLTIGEQVQTATAEYYRSLSLRGRIVVDEQGLVKIEETA